VKSSSASAMSSRRSAGGVPSRIEMGKRRAASATPDLTSHAGPQVASRIGAGARVQGGPGRREPEERGRARSSDGRRPGGRFGMWLPRGPQREGRLATG